MRERGRQAGKKGAKKIEYFKGTYWREFNQNGDRQRETDNQIIHQLVHSDTLCIRTNKGLHRHSFMHFFHLFAKRRKGTV